MDENDVQVRERLTAVEQSLKSLHKRQDHSDELIKSVYEMAVEVKNMRETLNNVVEQVEEVKNKPVKKWESVTAAIIGAIAGGIGTALAGLIIH